METEIISGFPGIGKTHYTNNVYGKILDSDSSKFSWIEKGVRHPDFPKNYMEHIKENIGKVEVIMVSSHKVVRDALVEAGIKFTLIYPFRRLKEEYLKRFKDRGDNEEFINMIDKNWDKFIDELNAQESCKSIELPSKMYLVDYFNEDK